MRGNPHHNGTVGTVSARASDVYRCFVIATKFAEDRWVTKVEYAPGNRKLVHHVLSYIDTTSAAEALKYKPAGIFLCRHCREIDACLIFARRHKLLSSCFY